MLRISITDKFRKAFTENSSSLWTHHIHGRCHKDITDVKNKLTDEKYDP